MRARSVRWSKRRQNYAAQKLSSTKSVFVLYYRDTLSSVCRCFAMRVSCFISVLHIYTYMDYNLASFQPAVWEHILGSMPIYGLCFLWICSCSEFAHTHIYICIVMIWHCDVVYTWHTQVQCENIIGITRAIFRWYAQIWVPYTHVFSIDCFLVCVYYVSKLQKFNLRNTLYMYCVHTL